MSQLALKREKIGITPLMGREVLWLVLTSSRITYCFK